MQESGCGVATARHPIILRRFQASFSFVAIWWTLADRFLIEGRSLFIVSVLWALRNSSSAKFPARSQALDTMTLLVTGGAGFIGSNFIRHRFAVADEPIVNLDQLTYAGNPDNLADLAADRRYHFICGSIGDEAVVREALAHKIDRVVNFAAETHVDRSIHGPDAFIATNITATYRFFEYLRNYYDHLQPSARTGFRLIHVSTDEVYGALAADARPSREGDPYFPNSPYSAAKAASDHLARAWFKTYGLPSITTHCSNNYGPRQFPEKLIPLTITNALTRNKLPIYGDGQQRRNWLYVDDHCRALSCLLEGGEPGEVYHIGGDTDIANYEIVTQICDLIDALHPDADQPPRRSLMTQVADRPGHDRRYAVDSTRLRRDYGWRPEVDLADGLQRTIAWYLDHPQWLKRIAEGAYRDWMATHYGEDA